MKVRNYQELIVWQRAMDLVERVYLASRHFPREETYGLTSQIRRAVISIPSNIAEGQGRRTTPDFRAPFIHCLWFVEGGRNANTNRNSFELFKYSNVR